MGAERILIVSWRAMRAAVAQVFDVTDIVVERGRQGARTSGR
jgi:hypothetical protein